MSELMERLRNFQHKLNMHYATRNSNNVDEVYVQRLEDNINKIIKLMAEYKQSLRKVS